MIVNVQLVGDRELVVRFQQMPSVVFDAVYAKASFLALKLENMVKTRKLDGQVLNRITGALARSITHELSVFAGIIQAKVYSSGDVKYAGIHEFGGVIQHPGGTAYFSDGGGKAVFVSNLWASGLSYELPRTKPHPIRMPERSFLRSSLSDMSEEISTGLKESAFEAIKKQVEG